jgi:hypothetical protein
MTEMGMPITSLGKLLGHARVSTTQIYTAGADPQLAEAYQSAMSRLGGEAPATSTSGYIPPSPPPTPLEPVGLPPSPPPLPDGDAWAPNLTPGLRKASLDYVHRRALAYPPKRLRYMALHDLAVPGSPTISWSVAGPQMILTCI